MKKVFGAGIALTSFLGVGEVTQAQPSQEQCAPVYDETLRGDSSTALSREIEEYAEAGTDVHVQIVIDGTKYGIREGGETGRQQAARYREELTAECAWNDQNIVNVLVSTNPRVFETFRDGQAEDDINRGDYEDAEVRFIENLGDADTPFQSDVAVLLNDINPYDEDVIPQEADRDEEPSEPSEPMHIPFKEILGALAGLTMLGGIGARGYKGYQLKSIKKGALANAEEVKTALSTALIDSNASLSIVHDDDAINLRAGVDEGYAVFSQLDTSQNDVKEAYARERFRLWPQLYSVVSQAEILDDIVRAGRDKAEYITNSSSELANDIQTIDQQITTFAEQLDYVKSMITQLTHEGWWDLSIYTSVVSHFETHLANVRELRENRYVDQPSDIIEEYGPELGELGEKVKALPERLSVIQSISKKQEKEQATYNSIEHNTSNLLTLLKADFHPSCTQDIAEIDSEARAALAQIDTIRSKMTNLVGDSAGNNAKSASTVEEAEQLMVQYNETTKHLIALSETVTERQKKIETIREGLPIRLTTVESLLENTRDYSFNTYADDVEEATRDDLTDLANEFRAFHKNTTEKANEKLPYLEIDKAMNKFETSSARIAERAKDEKTEMDSLRREVSSLEDRARQELQSVESYVSSHRSDIDSSSESTIANIRLLRANESASRGNLRAQIDDFNQLMQEIARAEQEAQSDVRREEEKRAAERRRKQQEEDEERRRRQRSSSSSSGSSFGGSSFGGFDGGSSFGGGGDSGGSSSGGSW